MGNKLFADDCAHLNVFYRDLGFVYQSLALWKQGQPALHKIDDPLTSIDHRSTMSSEIIQASQEDEHLVKFDLVSPC